ncbi:MAG: DUF6133 family protein [Oscillospiraceae bacterium]|nr:DUF6133 family protein [Oscillospiraceae bacterium]
MFKGLKARLKERFDEFALKMTCAKESAVATLSDDFGGVQIGLAVKIIIGVVIGALVLGGIYVLWENVIMPRLEGEVNSMFGHSSP